MSTLLIAGNSLANNAEGIRVYKTVQRVTEEHKESIAADISRYKNAENIWDVLKDEFSLPHYENNPLVQEKIEWYMNNQEFLLRSATRSAPYLYYILQQVKKKHLPAELVLLPIVESGYNPMAISSAGAAGIWQMMPDTASSLGIRQDWWYDGRRDVVASTRAALNYLAYLQSFFDGNWLLAIAAYNTGEGNVSSAIKKNIRIGKKTDFWSLPVAHQTKNYVPSILALAIIISKPDKYPVYFPPVRNAPYLAQIDVRSKINLRYAAKLAGLSYRQLFRLNSGFKRPSAQGPYRLILPIENLEQFSENLIRSPYHNKNAPEWIHYRVKTGDSLYSIAKKYETSVKKIRELNHLSKSKPVRGTNLLIPVSSQTRLAKTEKTKPAKHYISNLPENNHLIANKVNRKLKQLKNSKTVATKSGTQKKYVMRANDTIYMVRKNDTINGIAYRYKVTPKELATANNLSPNSPIKINQRLVIPTHLDITVAGNSKSPEVKPGETVYIVRPGDTINKIAQKYKVSPASIRLANMIKDGSLMAGSELVIPLPIKI